MNNVIHMKTTIPNALVTVINEITMNIWPAIYSVATAIEEMASVYNSHVTDSDANFDAIADSINNLTMNIEKQDTILAKNMNKSLQALNKQMTNHNAVLNKQVIELSKSVSKITGEQ